MRTRPSRKPSLEIYPAPTTWLGHPLLSGNVSKTWVITRSTCPTFSAMAENSRINYSGPVKDSSRVQRALEKGEGIASDALAISVNQG